MSQEFKAQRYCGRRLSPGAFHCHPPSPRIQGQRGQEIPAQQQRGNGGTRLWCSLSLALCFTVEARQDAQLACVRWRNHHNQPSKLQLGGMTGHPERDGYGPAAQQRKQASFQELDHGGGGASGVAERPALQGREEPTLTRRQRGSRPPAA